MQRGSGTRIGNSDINEQVAIDSEMGWEVDVRPEKISSGGVDGAFTKQVGGNAICAEIDRAERCNKSSFSNVMPPRPETTPITTLADTIVKTPRVELRAAWATQGTIRTTGKFAERDARTKL